ncbi:MAG: O-antigen translocase [Winogradskyella sp.]|uniref:O-antigen translocase n=1 Tax=Winogradskyella sp. TaxID=1883156 RepID=UPI001813E8B6|nr:O-antigen translocase [Winogradskyella sp.]MBT8245466.1 O-antigen translocase [Winogradskyella sp.]NNK22313.1 O-antigen translocase [Winogradskyella sp.]
MKKFNNYINSIVLFNVANLNSFTIGIKIIAGLLISKFIAIFIGAEGLALIGNLSNFLKAIQSFSALGFYKGMVKLISEFKEKKQKLSEVLSTAFYVGFLSTMLAAFLSYYFANSINTFLFGNIDYVYVIEILAFILPLYIINAFCFAIMNGHSKYKFLLIINIIGQIGGLLITLLLIWQDKIDGALVAIVITPALMFLITLVGILFRTSLVQYVKITSVSSKILSKLSPYSIMAITSAVALPLVMILIRNYIINEIGLREAGYWQAMNRISDYYLMFVNSLIALYLVPKLSNIYTKRDFRIEVIAFYKNLMPYFGGLLLLMYLLRKFVVRLIFSEEFLPTESLFMWQFLGDFIRVLAMVIAYQFLAKKMFSHFIILEIFLFVILYFSSIYLIDVFGLEGAVMGHFLTHLLHLGIVILIFSSSLFGIIPEDSP